MYKIFNCKKTILAFTLLVLLSFVQVLSAQDVPNDITEGNDYWFAIPNCKTAQGEIVRWFDSPILIWVSSKYETSFTISSEDGTTVAPQTYNLSPGVVREINLGLDVMLTDNDNERPTWKGVHIQSGQPVTVGVFVAYKWSGEAYRVIPTEWLGQEYYSVNLWQDKMKMASGGDPELKPGEIVIVASSEGTTNIEYTPKVKTPHTAKGDTKTISLKRGQTYLIQAYTADALSWNTEKSDLTGTYIKGDKPFAVLSGHTKGTFPQYPPTMYNIKADFIRNMLMEMMLPTYQLANEYISAPLKYANRIYGNAVANERGDLIRFVAVENNTVVKEGKFNSATQEMEYLTVSGVMNAGDFFDIPNRETPGYFVSTKKVMVAQIGKAWIDHLPPPKVGTGEEAKPGDGEIQNPSMNGQGMMLLLTPIQKWCSYASFKLISGMTGNYAYFTFKLADQEKLYFDEQKFTTRFGNAITPILGTPYAYMVQSVAPGDHTVYGTDGATFAGYCYGNYDACKDGFAYGYPIGMNFANICADTLISSDTTICDSTFGRCMISYKGTGDTSCLGFWRVSMNDSESENVEFNLLTPITDSLRECQYNFKVKDMNLPAIAKVTIKTRSGRQMTKEYSYTPFVMNLNRNKMDFGTVQPGEKDSCQVLKLQNNTLVPLTLNSMSQLGTNSVFSVSLNGATFPLTLNPGEDIEFSVCASPQELSLDTLRDTIRIVSDCYTPDVFLSVSTQLLRINLTDIPFGTIDENQHLDKTLLLNNNGNVDLMLNEFHYSNGSNGAFIPDTAGQFPMLLKTGETKSISVEFRPTHIGTFQDSAWVVSQATSTKTHSVWTGVAKQKVSVGESNNLRGDIEVLPNPTDNEFTIRINSVQVGASLKVELFDILGNCVSTMFNGTADNDVKILNCSVQKLGLSSGKYLLKVTQDGKVQMQHLLVNN